MFFVSIFLLCIAFFGDISPSANDNLVAVIQIFRHGQRTPVIFNEYDNYSDKKYWNGLSPGDLTTEGRIQQYQLGKLTRNLYSDFLPQEYNEDFFFVYTIKIDRIYISVEAFLYGLFPERSYKIWRKGLGWLRLPVHYADHRILRAVPFTCHNYFKFWKEILNTKKYLEILDKYKDVFAYLDDYTGGIKNNMQTSFLLFQNLDIENEVGLQLPKWSEKVFPEPLQTISAMFIESFTHTVKLQRYYTGPLLKQMMDYLNDKAGNNTFSQKYIIYSAHDTNLAALLNTFGAFDPPHLPAFGSSMWIELREALGQYYVNIWYKNNEDLKPITVKGCDFNCSLDDFNALFKSVSVDLDTWDKECSAGNPIRLSSALGLFQFLLIYLFQIVIFLFV